MSCYIPSYAFILIELSVKLCLVLSHTSLPIATIVHLLLQSRAWTSCWPVRPRYCPITFTAVWSSEGSSYIESWTVSIMSQVQGLTDIQVQYSKGSLSYYSVQRPCDYMWFIAGHLFSPAAYPNQYPFTLLLDKKFPLPPHVTDKQPLAVIHCVLF